MNKPTQRVVLSIAFNDGTGDVTKREIDGVTTANIRSKVTAAVKLALTQYNLERGATITIDVSRAVEDELANPER